MDSTTSSSPRERVYKAYFEVMQKKGLAPPTREFVKDKYLNKIVKIVDETNGAEPESFIRAQFYGMKPIDCSMLSLKNIASNKKRSVERFYSYHRKYKDAKNYKAEILRLNATVAYYAKTWECSEQEVVSDPNIAFPCWYRYVRLEDPELKRRYGAAAVDDVADERLTKAMEDLGYASN